MPEASGDNPLSKVMYAQSASSKPTLDGVELTVHVALEGPSNETVPVRILLEPEVAAGLCPGLQIAAGVVERWRQNQ